jgi:signal transduction histidine kinase
MKLFSLLPSIEPPLQLKRDEPPHYSVAANRRDQAKKPRFTAKRILAANLALAALALATGYWFHWRLTERAVPFHAYLLQPGEMSDWKALGGTWQMGDNTLYNSSDERGAKLLSGSSDWKNYTFSADIRFSKPYGDIGLIVRSNDEMQGLDAYNGYYVGLRILDGTLIIGRSGYGWFEARPVPIPGGVRTSSWYRLRVTAYGCDIAASVQDLSTRKMAWVAFKERSCLATGRIGLRSVDTGGLWRNVVVAPAGRNDYLELRQHAASVERPLVFDGPPWWTPLHVGLSFAGILGIALLLQLVYFRILQWKTFTIMQERERLAHQIHDTMAQSFAGIGYQIQGIRRSVIRSAHNDSSHIAEQLGEAYQLVRKCHEEASTTITMLSASSPLTRQDLLQSLANTARKICRGQIEIHIQLQGDSTALNLRLADALLHIGQEAIANAASHSDPTELGITLGYHSDRVELVIEDNGKGFDYTPEKEGFGILGMQKRARDICGTLQILSTPGNGTRVRVTASLEQQKFRKRLLAVIKEHFTVTS